MTEIRKIQLTELEIVEQLVKICRKHKLNIWLNYGTLLGAHRNKGFIPWDDDVDLGMTREDFASLLPILENEWPAGFTKTIRGDAESKLNKKYPERGSLSLYKKDVLGVVDIFPIDQYFSNRFIGELWQKMYKYLVLPQRLGRLRGFKKVRAGFSNLAVFFIDPEKLEKWFFDVPRKKSKQTYRHSLADSTFKNYFRYEDIFPLKEIEFEGKRFEAPNNIHAYLTELYGPTYMTPPPEKKRVPTHTGVTLDS